MITIVTRSAALSQSEIAQKLAAGAKRGKIRNPSHEWCNFKRDWLKIYYLISDRFKTVKRF